MADLRAVVLLMGTLGVAGGLAAAADGEAAAGGQSTLKGHITLQGASLSGVKVTAKPKDCDCNRCKPQPCEKCCPASFAITDSGGLYTLQVDPGRYDVTAEQAGFAAKSSTVTVPARAIKKLDLKLEGGEPR
jgi:hypothetical protein